MQGKIVEIIVDFDEAGQLLTIKYFVFVRYMTKNVVGYAVYNNKFTYLFMQLLPFPQPAMSKARAYFLCGMIFKIYIAFTLFCMYTI